MQRHDGSHKPHCNAHATALGPQPQRPIYSHEWPCTHLFCNRSASQTTAPRWNSTTMVLPPNAK